MDFTPLTDYLHRQLELGVPGCELIVCRDHEVLYHECAGFSDAAHTRPAQPQDRYFIYSCTKPLTVTCAMQCLERGLFQLDDPVDVYLPAFKNVYLMRDGRRCPPQTRMTLRHLFTMTAGLDYDLRSQPILDTLARLGDAATTQDIVNALPEKPLCFEPGSRYQYSLCHDVLGAVIEVVSGMTLRDYMQKNLFAPLHMDRTDFYRPGMPCPDLAVQVGYDAGKVVPYPARNEFVPTPHYFSGGAGVVSCATDYAQFVDTLACGESAQGVRILQKPTIDLLRSEQLHDFSAAGVFTCTCGPDYGYGLGVRTRIAFNEGAPSSLGEFGWDGAAGMDMLIDPEHRISFVFIEHMRGWPALQGAIHLQIRDLLYPILSEVLD